MPRNRSFTKNLQIILFTNRLLNAGLFFTLLFSFAISDLTAQKTGVSGRVFDAEKDEPVSFANVAAYSLPDSSLAGGSTTGLDGAFQIPLSAGQYFLRVQFVSFDPWTSGSFSLNENKRSHHFDEINLNPASISLDEFVITEEIDQVEISADKRVFNVGKDATVTGGTATDVLQNLPSVVVDNEGNISLRGSSDVRIFINGRETGMTGFAVLEQLPADAIEKVELITNPSARYDAEGSAGIINIILKKNKSRGTNGKATVAGGYLHDYMAGISLNAGGKKLNWEGGYNVRYYENMGYSFNNRRTMRGDTITFLNQDRDFAYQRLTHNFNTGLDWNINDKQELSFRAVGMLYNRDRTDDNFYENLSQGEELVDQFERLGDMDQFRYNFDLSLSHSIEFDSSDHKLMTAVSYNASDDFSNQRFRQDIILQGTEDLFFDEFLERVNQNEWLQNAIGQVDYSRPFLGGELETGAKAAWRRIGSKYFAERGPDEEAEFDPVLGLNNEFLYDEWVSAAYLSYRGKFNKWSYMVGVRGEHTAIETELVNTGERNNKNYLDLFPSAFLGYQLSKRQQIQLNSGRRVNRPYFSALNPFVAFTDPFNIRLGNPDLDPEYTISSELNYILSFDKNMLNIGVFHRYTEDVIQRYRTLDDEGVARVVFDNIALSNTIGVDVFFNHQFTKKWRGNISLNAYWSEVSGTDIDPTFDVSFFSMFGRLSQTFTLMKDLNLQFNYFYRAPMETVQGRMLSMQGLDVALTHEFWNGNASLTVRVTDIFDTRFFRFRTEAIDFEVDTEWNQLTRRGLITFIYKFNNYKEKRGGRPMGGREDFEGM